MTFESSSIKEILKKRDCMEKAIIEGESIVFFQKISSVKWRIAVYLSNHYHKIEKKDTF